MMVVLARRPNRSVHQPLLGTTVSMTVWNGWFSSATRTQQAVVKEIERLMAVFDVFDDTSELRRHLSGETAGGELLEVQALASKWAQVADGAFSPSVERLRQRWVAAEEDGTVPSENELLALVRDSETPKTSNNLNAIAKGWIIDRAVESALSMRRRPRSLVVEAGGDLIHAGDGSQVVGIENPLRPYDNEPPLCEVRISNQAIATSGSARRYFTIAGQRYSHLLDPRTGWPVDHTPSATVIADDLATADVLATAVAVLGPEPGLELIDRIPATSCLIVDRAGGVSRSAGWPEDATASPTK